MLPHQFITELKKRRLTVAFAESMTCGLAIHKLVRVKGTTGVVQGGIVCYDERVKTEALKIPEWVIRKHTAESAEVTKRLARSLCKLIWADIHAAITGLATRGGSENRRKPVGTVFFSVMYRNHCYSYRRVFRGTQDQILRKSCAELYSFIIRAIKKNIPKAT